jgi:hypothetical protein
MRFRIHFISPITPWVKCSVTKPENETKVVSRCVVEIYKIISSLSIDVSMPFNSKTAQSAQIVEVTAK